jgi:hypothetical protein
MLNIFPAWYKWGLTDLNRISSFLQKIETFRWTTHLDECLQILDEQKECANDEILIQLVKMRLIIEKNRTHQGWLNDTSDAARHAENGAALFSDMKVQIFKSLPRDGTSHIPFFITKFHRILNTSWFSTLATSL